MARHKPILRCLRNGPTRRNLFGPVDRDHLQVEYQAALRRDLEEASRRWSFDFLSDEPLESSEFQWEVVPGTGVPPLYRTCILGQVRGQRSAETGVTPRGGRLQKENIPPTPDRCELKLETLERGEDAMKRKQTNITDFYPAKRRVVGVPRKSAVSSCSFPPSQEAAQDVLNTLCFDF
ncbi:cyclin-dependent kinase inhibitor 1 isoform X2 [Embiotoca jacksoni]